jgi:D-3-phosphoglycerate dehydrogenase
MPIARLRGQTLGLIGSGKIGLAVSQRMAAFGVSVLAYDPYVKQEAVPFTLTDWDDLLTRASILSIHCPLTESTRHLLGEEAFLRMRKKPIIINTSRGAIIDEAALVRALQSGQVSGAGLDVLEREPPVLTNPLLTMGNVVLAPHAGFYSQESISELKQRTARNVAAVLTGNWPSSVVNREVRGKTRAAVS